MRVSARTISNQVNDWKKKIPGLDELHEISRTMKKKTAGLLEVLRGARSQPILEGYIGPMCNRVPVPWKGKKTVKTVRDRGDRG